MKDESNKSKGFGFVCFKNANDAKKALEENNQNGLYVCEAKSKEQRQLELQKKSLTFKKSMQFLNLFVKGFDKFSTTEDDLTLYFRTFG
jgi:RNA recognition motif-containing protein